MVADTMFAWRALTGCVALVLTLCAPQANAQNDDSRIQQVMSSPDALAKAQEEGKRAAYFCANCHGDTGNSAYDYIPNLAGQHPAYLLTQIRKFADGRRQDDFMTGMIKVMKDEDRFNIAIYYSTQRVRSSLANDSAQAARGQEIYGTICKSCHGAEGHGNEKIARLAGQHTLYITQTLERYRKGTKERHDPIMGSIARRLSDADIAAVAAFIPTMK
jgi:cbb3-type cytochrome c oxidase subunit III